MVRSWNFFPSSSAYLPFRQTLSAFHGNSFCILNVHFQWSKRFFKQKKVFWLLANSHRKSELFRLPSWQTWSSEPVFERLKKCICHVYYNKVSPVSFSSLDIFNKFGFRVLRCALGELSSLSPSIWWRKFVQLQVTDFSLICLNIYKQKLFFWLE